jgi:putative transposase
MPRSRYTFQPGVQPHFITSTVVGGLPVFARPELAQIVLDSWTFLQSEGRLLLYGYVVMENHLHFVASAEDLATQVGDFRSFTARRILDWLQARHEERWLQHFRYYKPRQSVLSEHRLWDEGTHPQEIQDEAMMRQKLEYIHDNPVRRGYVDDPVHWRYSSARNYAALPGLLPVQTDWG